ncbi:MAG: transglutaminase family protein [Acidimicrobiia bacterium]
MGDAVRYLVVHRTSYHYDEPVGGSVNEARLLPRSTAHQLVQAATIEVTPVPSELSERLDFFGNRTHHLNLAGGFTTLEVTARSEVEVSLPLLPEGEAATVSWETAAAQLAEPRVPLIVEAAQFVYPSSMVTPDPELDEWSAQSFAPGRPLAEAATDLSHRIHTEFDYAPGATTTETSSLEVLRKGQGVCQDFTHLALACLRGRGLAARYVSGYVETAPPEGQPQLTGGDASHAWVSVWVPGHGWLDLDPTNDVVVGDRHITTAWGRDYTDVPPLKGVIFWEGTTQHMEVSVHVDLL